MLKYILVICSLTILVYANSISGGFVSDDIPTIVNNPDIGTSLYNFDLGSLTNWMAFKIGGLNPVVYHLFNVSIHIINTILVFYLLLLFFDLWPCFLAALVFAVHPVTAESVSWISGRIYAITTLFLLSSFILYIKAFSQDKINKKQYISSVLLYIVAIFNAWMVYIFPLILVVYDITYDRWKQRWKYWLPYIITLSLWFIVKGITITRGRLSDLNVDLTTMGLSNPIFNAAYSLYNHAKLVLWPMALTLYHEPYNITVPTLIVQLIILLFIICMLPVLFRKAKPVFLGLSIFVFFLSPSFSPVMISWLIAERYLYLPLVGFAMIIAYCLQRFFSIGKKKIIAAIVLIIIIGLYSARTIIRNNDWKDRATLWRATIKVSPLSPKAYNNMGDIYGLEGDVENAIKSFSRAIELKPDYADAYHNLASTYQQIGKLDNAIYLYKKAVFYNPRLYQSYQNLGAIYFNKKQYSVAKDYFKKALEINPDNKQIRAVVKQLEQSVILK